MKVREFIIWLEKQNQDLEVCVVEYEAFGDYGFDGEVEVETAIATSFDDPANQSTTTQFSLILGIEK